MYRDEGWYEGSVKDRPLSSAEIDEVKALTMADILLQTTTMACVPKDAFRIPSATNPLICNDDVNYYTPFQTNTKVY